MLSFVLIEALKGAIEGARYLYSYAMYIIGSDLISQYIKISLSNRDQDGHHVETLAFLVGYNQM